MHVVGLRGETRWKRHRGNVQTPAVFGLINPNPLQPGSSEWGGTYAWCRVTEISSAWERAAADIVLHEGCSPIISASHGWACHGPHLLMIPTEPPRSFYQLGPILQLISISAAHCACNTEWQEDPTLPAHSMFCFENYKDIYEGHMSSCEKSEPSMLNSWFSKRHGRPERSCMVHVIYLHPDPDSTVVTQCTKHVENLVWLQHEITLFVRFQRPHLQLWSHGKVTNRCEHCLSLGV